MVMIRRRVAGRWCGIGVAMLTLGMAGCGELDPAAGPRIEAVGRVGGVAFIDINGTGSFDAGDDRLTGLTVRVHLAGTGTELASAKTDSIGVFRIDSIPTGRFTISVDTGLLGDSLELFPFAEEAFTLGQNDTLSVLVGVGYPSVTLAELRVLPEGKKVFTTGFALNRRLPFGDGAVHLLDGPVAIRATNVDRTTLERGDSIRALGWTLLQEGRPTLDNVQTFVLTARATLPVGVNVTSQVARAGKGGELDAHLVTIQDAEITETKTVGGDFFITADDGSGPVVLKLRAFLGISSVGIEIDQVLTKATGLLVPDPLVDGQPATWHLEPRDGQDLTIRVPVPNP